MHYFYSTMYCILLYILLYLHQNLENKSYYDECRKCKITDA